MRYMMNGVDECKAVLSGWVIYLSILWSHFYARLKSNSKQALCGQAGVGVVELILILVVLVALVVIFKNNLTDIVNKAFSKINQNATTIQK